MAGTTMFKSTVTGVRINAPHVWSVLKQLFVPALVAVGYGWYDLVQSKEPITAFALVKAAGPALFLISWFIGLVLRTKKQATDANAFQGITDEIHSLRELLHEVEVQNPDPPPPRPTGPQGDADLMGQAFLLAQGGHSLAALLLAGVAFERALREFAHRIDLVEAERVPLLKILQWGRSFLPKDWDAELHRLRMIRNTIAHAPQSELDELGNVEGILDAYATAIHRLRAVIPMGGAISTTTVP